MSSAEALLSVCRLLTKLNLAVGLDELVGAYLLAGGAPLSESEDTDIFLGVVHGIDAGAYGVELPEGVGVVVGEPYNSTHRKPI